MDDEQVKTDGFSRRFLPAAVAVLALVVYGVTLNHWYSLQSLGPATLALNVDWWGFKIGNPLFLLLGSVIRWFPANSQVVVLNGMSAVCAAGVLAMLARTVSLLPQDRTHDQRLRNGEVKGLFVSPHDWLPPVFAVMVCGFQLSFWEHATVGTGEMLKLLLFAFVIWSLVEYRVDGRDWRLYGAFLVYGLGIATNWAMIGFLPIFGVALLWVKGLKFFRWRFLLSGLGLTLLGMSLYFYNPMVAAMDVNEPTTFWEMLRFELVSQRNPLLGYPKGRVIMLSVTSVLPLLLVAIRWPSNFGDVSGFGVALAGLLFRVVHLVFLGAILWVSFDPAFSPRALGYGLPMMTFYFLGALAVGYLSGYFLLIGGSEPVNKWRRAVGFDRVFGKALFGAMWLAVLAVPLLLLRQNLPRIRVENGDLVKRYAEQLAARLPEGRALVLGTGGERMKLLNAWLYGRGDGLMVAPMGDLGRPRFHKRAAVRYSEQWPDPGDIKDAKPISMDAVVRFLAGMNRGFPLWSLDTLDGTVLLESLYPVARGLAYELKAYRDDTAVEQYGGAAESAGIGADMKLVEAIAESLKGDLATGSLAAKRIGQHYSAWVNSLGVRAQMSGDLDSARWAFETALAFNSDNLNAEINLDVNTALSEGRPGTSEETVGLPKELAEARSWGSLLNRHGPIDEANVRTFFGELLIGNDMHRQAVQELARALTLNPTNVTTRLDLGRAYYRIGFFTNSLTVLEPVRKVGEENPLSVLQAAELERVTALNEYRMGSSEVAEQRLATAIARYDAHMPLRDALVTIYLESDRYTNALSVLEDQLRLAPDYRRAKFNLGPVYSQLGRQQEAIEVMTELLQVQTNNASLYANRASAYLGRGQITEAEADYRSALELSPSLTAYLGLGEVNLRRGDTNTAVGLLEVALRMLPADSAEAKALQERLDSLRGDGSKP